MEDFLYQQLFELENVHWWFVGKRKIVVSQIEKYACKKNGLKILDAGCGSGLLLNEAARFGKVYGLDISEEAIRFSKMLCDYDIRQGSLTGVIPYPEGEFDILLALDVLEHLDNDEVALSNIHKHLLPGGVAIITVPAFMFLWSRHDDVHQHKRRYTLIELRKKLKNAGFTIIKLSYYNTFFFLPICLIRLLKLGSRSGSDADFFSKRLNPILKSIYLFEGRILNRINFPFGVSLIAVVKKYG